MGGHNQPFVLWNEPLFWVFCWAIGGIIGAAINTRKGWDATVGFFGGFILGPVLVWLFLLQSDNKKGMGLKKCPYCAEWVKRKATVCRYCHKELPPDIPVNIPPPQAIPVYPTINFACPSCRQRLSAPCEKAGVTTACRFCKQPVTIPTHSDA